MNIRYYMDAETGLPHLCRHGIATEEVEPALVRPIEDRSGRDDSRIAIGRTAAGRYVRIIYVPDPEPDSVFVITAYELRGKPLTAFKRRQRRRKT